MALAMARPWKHSKTGVYWLRRRVPDDLRAALGKSEEKRTLGTKDPTEAKIRHASALAEIEMKWSILRASQPWTLSERLAHQLTVGLFDVWLRNHAENPSEQLVWRTDLHDHLWPLASRGAPTAKLSKKDAEHLDIMRRVCVATADRHLTECGVTLDERSTERFRRAVAAAFQRASMRLEQMAMGGTATEHGLDAFPATSVPSLPVGKPLLLEELFEAWAAERQPARKTLYEWRRALLQFRDYLGWDDARRLTPDHIRGWKTSLIDAGQTTKTIRDAKLAPLRAVLQWAADDGRLPSNPAQRVSIDLRSKPGQSKRSFTDDEARLVLSAARQEADPVRRWVPWLCAYSGARVAEVSQLRTEDVLQIEGVWCMKFDPSAGPLKTVGSERAVPLHPAILGEGFLEYVGGLSHGPIFPRLPPDTFGSRGGNATKIVGRWVRGLGITDERISPNHSWRHRLKTLARRYQLAPDIVSAITGHGRHSVADRYGEYPMPALDQELRKIPQMTL